MISPAAHGYGKPPKHTRFPPGQSGNPRGRKKGSRGLKTDLDAELKARFTLNINGKPVSGTKQQLMMKALTARAATGQFPPFRFAPLSAILSLMSASQEQTLFQHRP